MVLRVKQGSLLYSKGQDAVGLWLFNHGTSNDLIYPSSFFTGSDIEGHSSLGAKMVWDRLSGVS